MKTIKRLNHLLSTFNLNKILSSDEVSQYYNKTTGNQRRELKKLMYKEGLYSSPEVANAISQINNDNDITEQEVLEELERQKNHNNTPRNHKLVYYKQYRRFTKLVEILENVEINCENWEEYNNTMRAIAATIEHFMITTEIAIKIDRKTPIENINSKIERLKRKLDHGKKGIQGREEQEDREREIEEQIKKLEETRTKSEKRLDKQRQSRERKTWNPIMQKFGYKKKTIKQVEGEKPTTSQTREFWGEVYRRTTVTESFEELETVLEEIQTTTEEVEYNITEQEIELGLRRLSNWKAAANGDVQNYYIKKMIGMRKQLIRLIKETLMGKIQIPEELTGADIILIHKGGETNETSNYRPISLIPTITKLATNIMREKITKIIKLDKTQYANRKGSYGAKEPLLSSKYSELKHIKNKQQYWEIFYDIKKAYDTVPHDFLFRTMATHKIPKQMTEAIKNMYTKWKMTMGYGKGEKVEIQLSRGIAQGDALSPLLFTIIINPLARILQKIPEVRTFIYMDDIKIIATDQQQLAKADNLIQKFFSVLGMELNWKKCGLATHGPETHQTIEYPIVNEATPYKYLGVMQTHKTHNTAQRSAVHERIAGKLTQVDEKDIYNAINTIRIINREILSIVRYNVGPTQFRVADLNKINQTIRKYLKTNKMIAQNACTQRLYMPRDEMGAGLEDAFETEIIELNTIILNWRWNMNNERREILGIDRHLKTGMQETQRKRMKRFGINIKDYEEQVKESEEKKEIKKINNWIKREIQKWRKKEIQKTKGAGRLFYLLEDPEVDKETTAKAWKNQMWSKKQWKTITQLQEMNAWTKIKEAASAKQKTTDEQHQVVIDTNCPLCGGEAETVNHILTNCPRRRGGYIARHDSAIPHILDALLEREGVKGITGKEIAEAKEVVVETPQGAKLTIKCGKLITSLNPEIQKTKPDIIIISEEKIEILDVTIKMEERMKEGWNEKMKYEELAEDVARQNGVTEWAVTPVVIGVHGLLHKSTTEKLRKSKIRVKWKEVLRDLWEHNIQLYLLRYVGGQNQQAPNN